MMRRLFLVSHSPFSIWYFALRWWAHSCTTSLPFKAPPFGSNFLPSTPCLLSLTSSPLPFNISPAGSEACYFSLCLLSEAQTCRSSTLLLNWKLSLFRAIIRLTVWTEHLFSIFITWHSHVLFPCKAGCFFVYQFLFIVSFLCSLFGSWGDKR